MATDAKNIFLSDVSAGSDGVGMLDEDGSGQASGRGFERGFADVDGFVVMCKGDIHAIMMAGCILNILHRYVYDQ